MADSKSKKITNTKKEYDKAIVSEDPTKISERELEKLAKEAIKKFKSLG